MRSRPVYRRSDVERLIAPRSIALVGATDRAASLGLRTLENLRNFKGAVYPINAKRQEIAGRRCYASLRDLPEVPDNVILAVAQDQVEAIVRECADAGVGGVVIFASGYTEIDTDEGRAAQQRLTDIAQAANMRIIGPNTTGFANHLCGAHAGFAEFPPSGELGRGTIGLVTQSGALGLGLSQAGEHGASISFVLSAGNSCDIDVADHVSFLADEPSCRAIALSFEGLADPARLEQALLIAKDAGKPVVVHKLAASANGLEAARRHTGTNAGNDADYDAMFARCGALRIQRSETLIETATFLAKAPLSKVASTAVISSSGGTGIMSADIASIHGVAMPQPEGATLAAITAAIPSFGAARNPCDATAQATSNPQMMIDCAEAFLADPRYGALVVPWGKAYHSKFIEAFGQLGEKYSKPTCLVWMSQWLEGPGALEAERNPHVALFRSMDSCFYALSHHFRR